MKSLHAVRHCLPYRPRHSLGFGAGTARREEEKANGLATHPAVAPANRLSPDGSQRL